MSIKITRRFTQILDFHFNSIYLLEFRAKANDVYATIVELLVGSNVVISSLIRPIVSWKSHDTQPFYLWYSSTAIMYIKHLKVRTSS